jgi:hypothetical protein
VQLGDELQDGVRRATAAGALRKVQLAVVAASDENPFPKPRDERKPEGVQCLRLRARIRQARLQFEGNLFVERAQQDLRVRRAVHAFDDRRRFAGACARADDEVAVGVDGREPPEDLFLLR